MKILLIEDNEMNRDMLSRRLSRKGYEVVLATTGEQGIQQARSVSPDIILMDIGLPGMDGWEVTRHLKGTTDTRKIPVIALTAHALNSDRDRALAAGCDEYETKPIDFQKLLAKIENLTGSTKS